MKKIFMLPIILLAVMVGLLAGCKTVSKLELKAVDKIRDKAPDRIESAQDKDYVTAKQRGWLEEYGGAFLDWIQGRASDRLEDDPDVKAPIVD